MRILCSSSLTTAVSVFREVFKIPKDWERGTLSSRLRESEGARGDVQSKLIRASGDVEKRRAHAWI